MLIKLFKDIVWNLDKYKLPGQGAILQSMPCLEGPSQSFPPCCAMVLIHLLDCCTPIPHVDEHLLHFVHSLQTQSTENQISE